ncbi:MAG: hypothetical protein RL173_177 [Fibrobacterota bacterium]|jgi:CMP-N-acetylneuraminic acid synthetase
MEIIAVVPAASSNRYSSKGDLVEWGHTTLLEWKLYQLKSVQSLQKIIVSTSSKEVARRATDAGVEVMIRNENLSLAEIFSSAAEQVPLESHILWANPTSPFVGAKVFSALIEDYRSAGCPVDGEVTARSNREYTYFNGIPLGFSASDPALSRVHLEPLQTLTNGAYLSSASEIVKNRRAFGKSPRFFEVDWLAALEIRDAMQMNLFSSLLASYFESEP